MTDSLGSRAVIGGARDAEKQRKRPGERCYTIHPDIPPG